MQRARGFDEWSMAERPAASHQVCRAPGFLSLRSARGGRSLARRRSLVRSVSAVAAIRASARRCVRSCDVKNGRNRGSAGSLDAWRRRLMSRRCLHPSPPWHAQLSSSPLPLAVCRIRGAVAPCAEHAPEGRRTDAWPMSATAADKRAQGISDRAPTRDSPGANRAEGRGTTSRCFSCELR